MADQIPELVKASRSQILQAMNGRNRESYIRRFLGRELEALFEETVLVDGRTWWSGYSREYIRVLYVADHDLSNQILSVRGEQVLYGEYLVVTERPGNHA